MIPIGSFYATLFAGLGALSFNAILQPPKGFDGDHHFYGSALLSLFFSFNSCTFYSAVCGLVLLEHLERFPVSAQLEELLRSILSLLFKASIFSLLLANAFAGLAESPKSSLPLLCILSVTGIALFTASLAVGTWGEAALVYFSQANGVPPRQPPPPQTDTVPAQGVQKPEPQAHMLIHLSPDPPQSPQANLAILDGGGEEAAL